MKTPSLKNLLLSVFIVLISFCGIVLAQPDSGTLLKEQRQSAPAIPDRFPEKEVIKEAEAPSSDTGVKIPVREIKFTGDYSKMATEVELYELVREKIGKELTFFELKQMALHITNYLREKKGFLLARAYLPEQDVTDGIIEIRVLAGQISGKANINVREPARVRKDLLQGMADNAIPENSSTRMDKIERAVLLINDLPGIKAQASLEPGATPGSTSLKINASEDRLIQGLLSADNHGDRYTGYIRGAGQIFANDPFGLGDQIAISYVGAEDMIHGIASYALPIGYSGLNGDISYSYLHYELGEEMKPLNAKGQAQVIGSNLSYPVVRSRRASLWLGLGFEYLDLWDEANSIKTRDRELAVGSLNLKGNFFDQYKGGGLTIAEMTFYAGNADLSGLTSNRIADAAGPDTHGGFSRLTYSIARLQRMTQATALFVSLRGQLATGNLDSSQKFILGGPYGVRSYPSGEGAGDAGHMGTVEIRYDLPPIPYLKSTQLIGFYDTGWIKLNHDPWLGAIVNATGKNDYVLSSGGIGLNIQDPGVYSLRATYAHKTGSNDGRSIQGKNADNRAHRGRFWVQFVLWF
ncbi:MAG: ShlB/FhaC/HecB family hemolysin secretion/activation protein [Deltaproteobacteria bacterium]|nr:ShlB/FhaC/HecB family hemolysin secretion/activation protein [Deltaproteobacteria bacterium]